MISSSSCPIEIGVTERVDGGIEMTVTAAGATTTGEVVVVEVEVGTVVVTIGAVAMVTVVAEGTEGEGDEITVRKFFLIFPLPFATSFYVKVYTARIHFCVRTMACSLHGACRVSSVRVRHQLALAGIVN